MKNRRSVVARFAPAILLAAPFAARAATISSLEFLGSITVPQLIARVITGILGLTGSLALAFFIYGGVLWMTAQGKEEQIKKAKATITWAAIGIFAIFVSYGAVKLVFSFLQ